MQYGRIFHSCSVVEFDLSGILFEGSLKEMMSHHDLVPNMERYFDPFANDLYKIFLDENLLLRRTQGDLLQKLRQLQQWRQQQEEHLQQDKEKQLSLLRDKERRLHAVQEYQRKILQNNNVVSGRMGVGPLHQVKPTGFHEEQSSRTVIGMQPSKNMAMSYSRTGYNPPAKTVLLSPQHFTSSNKVK